MWSSEVYHRNTRLVYYWKINVIHDKNKLKRKDVLISIKAEVASEKNPASFPDKNSQHTRKRREFPSWRRASIRNKCFLYVVRTNESMSTQWFSIQHCTEGSSWCHKPEKIKGDKTEKEEASLFYKLYL